MGGVGRVSAVMAPALSSSVCLCIFVVWAKKYIESKAKKPVGDLRLSRWKKPKPVVSKNTGWRMNPLHL